MKHNKFAACLATAIFALGASGMLITGCAQHQIQTAAPGTVAGMGQVKFAVLSDLHFNPFLCANQAYTNLAGPPITDWADTFAAYEAGASGGLDRPGQDASYFLIRRTLSSLTNHCTNLALVLCTGDYFAHQEQLELALRGDSERFRQYLNDAAVRSNYLVNAEGMVAEMLREAGLTNVYPTLGNNDALGDYTEPSPALLGAFAKAWGVCTPPGTFGPNFEAFGSFTAQPPGLIGCRIVAFDSSFFSGSDWHLQDPGSDPRRSQAALDWLTQTLASSDERALLLFHIPPGLDYYQLLRDRTVPLWGDPWGGPFLDLVASNHDRLVGSFCSHTHNDEFRLLYVQQQPVHYFHISPSVSPVHGNSPAYQIFTATSSGRILDYSTYFLANFPGTNESWQQEYAFSDFSGDGYGAKTLAGAFFTGGAAATNQTKFYSNYYAPGLISPGDPAVFWQAAHLETTAGK
jgi:hypothetical protein